MGHKILLADDSITVQKIVKLTFSDEGIEVVAVGNGELALQQLMDWRPDLVMADVFMPGRDGYEVCQFIKTNPELRHIPVVLLVHAFEPFDQARAAEVGADCHLTKPFHSIRTLVSTVRELTQRDAKTNPSADSASQPSTYTASAAGVSAFSSARPDGSEQASYETAPLSFATQPGSGSGEVIRLRSQPESELPPPAVAFQPALDQAVPAFPSGAQFPSPARTDFSESGQLLTISANGDFGQNFTAPAVAPEPLPEPETISLLAVTETNEVLSPDIFAPLAKPAVVEPPSASFAELISPAEPVISAPASFQDNAAPVEAAEEVLELEEVLPQTQFAQVGEMEILAETVSLHSGAPASVSESAAAFDSSFDLMPEPEALPVLAEVADNTRFDSSGSVNTPERDDSASRVFSGDSGAAGLQSETAVSEIQQGRVSVEGNIAPANLSEIPVTGTSSFSTDYGVGHVLDEPEAADTEIFAGQGSDALFTETSECPAAETSEVSSVAGNASASFELLSDSAGSNEPFADEKQDIGVGQDVSSGKLNGDQMTALSLSPALIDEIVNRVVARLSEKAIQQIAWEVVPEMAEVIIRRQLAEKQH
ncbi:MAG TPA: response regulator [Blastocatellia bacterium]|nr:response regulator [Blastocatellia bacterium]